MCFLFSCCNDQPVIVLKKIRHLCVPHKSRNKNKSLGTKILLKHDSEVNKKIQTGEYPGTFSGLTKYTVNYACRAKL
jgi:hypothetical protein